MTEKSTLHKAELAALAKVDVTEAGSECLLIEARV
jgi:hypothetical protein